MRKYIILDDGHFNEQACTTHSKAWLWLSTKIFFCALSEASIYRAAFVILYERVYMFTYLFVPNNRQAFENKRVVDLALKSSIPGALLPVLENFRRRFFWPNWPPLGLWGCSQQCWMLEVLSVSTPFSMLLDVVACCCAKFETGQTFSPLQTAEATFKSTLPTLLGVALLSPFAPTVA